MNGPPIQLAVCLLTKDMLAGGSLTLTVGVRDKRRHVTEESYEVRAVAGGVDLVKEDGEVYEVRQGGSCTCDDARYRKRDGGCKHSVAAHAAGLFARQAKMVTA